MKSDNDNTQRFEQVVEEKARRYNKGKIRPELISPIAAHELAKVYTSGSCRPYRV